MNYNQMREEGQAIHNTYLQNASEWRRARNHADETPAKPISIKRLALVPVMVVNLLIGR
jgi:hypothetical protein